MIHVDLHYTYFYYLFLCPVGSTGHDSMGILGQEVLIILYYIILLFIRVLATLVVLSYAYEI